LTEKEQRDMAEENPIDLSPELLNDFFAESDEHLTDIREALLALERDPEGAQSPALFEKLFRSFHSLKGILGMAGIRSAEQLAHRIEDFLRKISKGEQRFSPGALDVLAAGSELIAQTVAAFRNKAPLPDVSQSLVTMDSLVQQAPIETEHETPKAADSLQLKIEAAAKSGNAIWKCTFAPSPELNERGVNVNEIRKRLSAFGEIIHAAPRVENGAVAFEFFISAKELPPNVADWKPDGMAFEKVRESSAMPGAPEAAPATPVSLFAASSHIIRVELSRLDDLMRISGELIIQRARLEKQIRALATLPGIDLRGLQEVDVGLGRQFRELRETVMRLRLVPIAEIFDRLPFVVRDLTRDSKKKVRLAIHGQRTELDKYVVERLKDPLLHLVRNAVSHGIEDAESRVAQGKSPEGNLTLSAKTAGEMVVITIADDGQGLDREKIAARAAEIGIQTPPSLNNAALLDLICRPGFSTREEADLAAGRGVGMAVVSNTLRELGGNLGLESEEGKGTTFTMRLPLTLLITDALIVSAADQQFAIPQGSVEEVLHIEEANVRRMDKSELVSVRGTAMPLVRLRDIFGFPASDRAMPSVIVSQTDRGRVGLVVDRINGQRQVVVRSLRDPLLSVSGVVGATELGDGKPLLILDPTALTKNNGGARKN
jgi:two-component system chemotaxis sensor kinase CheA